MSDVSVLIQSAMLVATDYFMTLIWPLMYIWPRWCVYVYFDEFKVGALGDVFTFDRGGGFEEEHFLDVIYVFVKCFDFVDEGTLFPVKNNVVVVGYNDAV